MAVSRRRQLAEKRRKEGVWMRSKVSHSECVSCGSDIARGDSILYFPPPWQEDRAAWLNKETRVRGTVKCEACGRSEQERPMHEDQGPQYEAVAANW